MVEMESGFEKYAYIKKDFSPCSVCSNVYTRECLDKCVRDQTYFNLHISPGMGIKDLPPFPFKDVLTFPNPYYRLAVIVTYITALTDYLQYIDYYKLREQAPTMEPTPKELLDIIERMAKDGRPYTHNPPGKPISSDVQEQGIRSGAEEENPPHSDQP